jgi:hypothetical protein
MRLTANQVARRIQDSGVKNMEHVLGHKIADSYFKVGSEGLSLEERALEAGLLSNFAKIMDSAEGQALTTSQDFGPYVMEVWPLVTAWYPDFPLKDLISVQHMDKPLAYMFFSLLQAGTNKAPQAAGDVVETPLGMRQLRGKYPTGEIVGESILDNQIDATDGTIVAYYPLNVETIPGYIEKTRVFISTNTYQAYTVANGEILFKLNGTEQARTVIRIDVATGVLTGSAITSLAGSAGTEALRVNYVWNLDYATTENIQKVKETVELRPMEATPRALMLEWTLFSEYLKKSQFGQDIRETNIKRILNLMYQYQIRYILDELYDGATGTYTGAGGSPVNVTTINLAISSNYSLEVQAANVLKQLKALANKVELASGRMEGNRIVVGQDFKAWCESMPSNIFKPTKNDASAFSGPREIGELSTFKIYYDPMRGADEGMMTYRGNEWYDATYYLGEYMPIVPTDAIALGVTVRESFVSMEAYKYDKPSCVFRIQFT